jgi:predicted GIY-YIG superfamily endonuclease
MQGIYLIHFDTPYKHAQHYVGFATDIAKRLNKHKSGKGARLMQVIQLEGIEWQLARLWKDGTRTEERKLKNRGSAKRYCPICQQWHDMLPKTRSTKLQQFIKA